MWEWSEDFRENIAHAVISSSDSVLDRIVGASHDLSLDRDGFNCCVLIARGTLDGDSESVSF